LSFKVWVTRSQPGAGRQADALRASGFDVIVAPVLEIEPTGAAEPVAGFDIVIFLSEQAVLHGGTLHYCRDAAVYAVGARTGRVLAERGIDALLPESASSEGLLRAVADLELAGRPILIVAGMGGRKALVQGLEERGAEVEEFLCYRRLPTQVTIDGTDDVDVVLVGSQDGFRHVARLWFDQGGSAAVRIVAASQRIADLGPELGFENVRIARGAATEDWLKALE
jgi:uroporphyrinogen-III synthase